MIKRLRRYALDRIERGLVPDLLVRLGLRSLIPQWSFLTLWMAERYSNSTITAVSNSASQCEHIRSQAADRGLTDVDVLTRDLNGFEMDPGRFDRVVSVEVFEHRRNWPGLTHPPALSARPIYPG